MPAGMAGRRHTAGMTLPDRELEAMQQILELLRHLDEEAQRRVTSWVQERIVTAHGVRPQDVPAAPPALNLPKARAFVERKAPRTMTERLAHSITSSRLLDQFCSN